MSGHDEETFPSPEPVVDDSAASVNPVAEESPRGGEHPSYPTPSASRDDGDDDDADDEKDTCGFCIYMKGGGCKKPFNAWSKCVDREREISDDFALNCQKETLALRECMLAHREYYGPMLDEEEAAFKANEAVAKEIQAAKS